MYIYSTCEELDSISVNFATLLLLSIFLLFSFTFIACSILVLLYMDVEPHLDHL